jgi:hypothetical protein
MANIKRFAVVDRDGYSSGRTNTTTVYSAHATQGAAIAAARPYKVNGKSSAMVISSEGGFAKGETVYLDTIRKQYPVVW